MKCFLLIAIGVAVCAANVLKDPSMGYKKGDRYFYFPGDGDGVLHLVDALEAVDEAFIEEYTRNPANNGYWLYTRGNPTTPQVLVNVDSKSIHNSNFDPSKLTVFLVHGWNGYGGNSMNKRLTEAFLQNSDVNVIVLDWYHLAGRNYVTAKRGTAGVGKLLGQFIKWLVPFGVSYERVHLVGFSLGAHLIGNAGRETGGLIRRITALDPAGPLWGSDEDRLTPTDAKYVEVIHTNTAFLGYTEPCGSADFYPNGGSSMPGCWISPCSHSKASDYMASTVENNHLMANECDTYEDATNNRCSGELYPMGNSDLNKSRSGIFRVNTARYYPY